MAVATGDLIFISSQHRRSYPNGSPNNFFIPPLAPSARNGPSHLAVKKVILPKPYANIRAGINDTLVIDWTSLPAGYADPGNYTLTLGEGNYSATSLANAINTALASSIVAAPWAVKPTFTVTYDNSIGGLVFTGTPTGVGVFGFQFGIGANEQVTGVPAKYPSQRLALQLGLHNYYNGVNFNTYTGRGTFTISNVAINNLGSVYNNSRAVDFLNPSLSQTVVLNGPQYVDVVLNLPGTGIFHSGGVRGSICRVPMADTELGQTKVFEPTVIYEGAKIHADIFGSQINVSFRDDEGFLLNIDGTREVSLELLHRPDDTGLSRPFMPSVDPSHQKPPSHPSHSEQYRLHHTQGHQSSI